MLKPLNTPTAALFNRLFQLADESESKAAKLDRHNYDPNEGGIMPTCVEHLAWMDGEHLEFFSVAHYYQQNGDAMRDPDVIFARHRTGEHPNGGPLIWPVSFRQDAPPVNQEAIMEFDSAGMPSMYRRDYGGLLSFCTMWARNIKAQQGVDPSKSMPVSVAA